MALLSYCLYALGLSKSLVSRGASLRTACQGLGCSWCSQLAKVHVELPMDLYKLPSPLGLKHTLEGQVPWVQDSGSTAPLSVPQAAVHGHLDCRWCHLCSSFLLSNLPLLSGDYQRFFSEGKDAPRAQLTPVWHLLTKQISGSGPSWRSPKMATCHSGNVE